MILAVDYVGSLNMTLNTESKLGKVIEKNNTCRI